MRDLMPIGLTTADQLLRLPRGQHRYELVRGELHTMSPAGWRHGAVAAHVGRLLAEHVQGRALGLVFAAETGFLLERDPDTVLAPDASFVRRERLAALSPRGYFPGAPDLAIEVRSPDDSAARVARKTKAWLDCGCACVVHVDPDARTATVHRPNLPEQTFEEHATLDLAFVVPDLHIELAAVFAL
jgi:Uma2 family endonuclease